MGKSDSYLSMPAEGETFFPKQGNWLPALRAVLKAGVIVHQYRIEDTAKAGNTRVSQAMGISAIHLYPGATRDPKHIPPSKPEGSWTSGPLLES